MLTTSPPLPAREERNRFVVLGIVLTAVFMQLLDTTITTVAIPSIQTDLDGSFGAVQLVLAGYSLAFACVLITASRLGDIYGRKRLFLIGMAAFTLASAVCGAAPSATVLVVARIVQGLCSGLMFPQVLSIIQLSFGPAERPKALGFYGATIGLATILGPVLGGALIELDLFGADWRTIFYVNVPIGLGAFVLGVRGLAESRAAGATRLDLPGAALVTTGLFALVLPLVIGRDHDWPAWSLALLAASIPLLAAFAFYERRRTARRDGSPLVPTTLFGQRSFSVGLLLSFVFFAGIPSFFFIFILSMQAGLGYSALKAGAVTLAFALTVAVGSARSAALTERLGAWVLALGAGLLTLGMAGVAATLEWAGSDVEGWDLVPALVVAGAGAGLFLAPVTNVILAGIHSRDAGAASGVLATMQQVGAAVGIAVAGVIFFGLLGSNAASSTADGVPQLRGALTAAHVPAAARERTIAGFRTCFSDRAHATDPSAVPQSCRVPAATPAPVRRAVADVALPAALRRNFTRTLEQSLGWQLAMFVLSFLLVLALPKVKPGSRAAAVA